MERKSGVLMHISSLFGDYSIGSFGKEAKYFIDFLKKEVPENPLKSEFFLPFLVRDMLSEGKCTVDVIETADKWFGVTYKEDKPVVVAAIKAMKESGLYPEQLWG